MRYARVSLAENERLTTVSGPHILEAPSVPEGLVEDEGNSDWVAGGALAIHEDNPDVGVDLALVEGNMRLQND